MRPLHQLCLCLASAAAILSAPIAAQATAITVGEYYLEATIRHSENPPTVGACNDANFCYWLFNVIPQGRQLIVTDVSCELTVDGPSSDQVFSAALMSFANGEITDREHALQPIAMATGNAYRYMIRGSTLLLFRAGERPIMRVTALTGGQGSSFIGKCTISGKVGNPPP